MTDKQINQKLAFLYGGWTEGPVLFYRPDGVGYHKTDHVPFPDYTGSLDLVAGILQDDNWFNMHRLAYARHLAEFARGRSPLRATAVQCCMAILAATGDYTRGIPAMEVRVVNAHTGNDTTLTLKAVNRSATLSLGAVTYHIPDYLFKPVREWFEKRQQELDKK